ncbi:hypothetical protein Ct61P_14526 [Colletotrichum tofieldiae]|nr:hypothetical protein Ct61P_14526 [Colletotrichum tofieldiae]
MVACWWAVRLADLLVRAAAAAAAAISISDGPMAMSAASTSEDRYPSILIANRQLKVKVEKDVKA